MNRSSPGVLERLADLSVIGSYSRIGYELASRRFAPDDLDVDLRGRVAIVTGASTGLGRAAAMALGRLGAHTVLVARSGDKLRAAAADIEAGGGRARVEVADLSQPDQVVALAARLAAHLDAVDILVQNAGVMLHRRELTPTGIERTFATNVLGPFLLQRLLEPLLRRAPAARVVHVTSGGMYTQRLDLGMLQGGIEPWDGVVSYAQTKRAQVVLNERWAAVYAGSHVTSNAMHPGWADTPGVETSLPGFHARLRRLLRTPEQGADTAVWLAASPAVAGRSGLLWLDRRPRATHVFPHTRRGDRLAEELWELCVRLSAPWETQAHEATSG